MAQASEFPLRKPPGFHYDFFLLGVTTFIAGLIGLPAPNGLIPQAPIHTKSLVVTGPGQSQNTSRSPAHSRSSESNGNSTTPADSNTIHRDFDPLFLVPASFIHEVPVAVIEQRVSNLAQGSLCLVLLTGPFLHVLRLIPRGVLAGLL
jgi:boron transporter